MFKRMRQKTRRVSRVSKICRDCGPLNNTNWYWYTASGQRLDIPRCSLCHESHIRLSTQQAQNDEPTVRGEPWENRLTTQDVAQIGARQYRMYVWRNED